MLTLVPSKDMETIALEFHGKATEEELEKLDKVIQEKFDDKGKFNIYLIVHYFDGASFQSMLEGMKMDVKRWSQYHKMAIISEERWLKPMAEFSNLLPGIKAEHFKMDEMEKAWEWIKE